jgi:hypothetical protein
MLGSEDGSFDASDEYEIVCQERNRVKMQKMQQTMKTVMFSKDEESLKLGEGLLSSSSSVKSSFKYDCCTICLTDFEKNDKVKKVPVCEHTFHEACLQQWLVRKFSCPNCNIDIKAPGDRPDRREYIQI